MKEDSNWFSNWVEDLPSPDELMPISQSLITPDLASAFDIRNNISLFRYHRQQELLLSGSNQNYGVQQLSSSTPQPPPTTQRSSPEFDESNSGEFSLGGRGGVGGGGVVGGDGGDDAARTLKRPRLVWTPQLHKRFVDAVAHLGIKNAVPKTIMTLMSVDGLTRENVASHLQKYRLYLKRMQGMNNGSLGNGPGGGDSATDQLFASSPVPAHFLHQHKVTVGGAGVGNGPSACAGALRLNPDQFMPCMPMASLQHQTMSAAQQQMQQAQYTHLQRQMGQLGSGGPLDRSFLSRPGRLGPNRNGMMQGNSGFVEDVESVRTSINNSRKALTLFPNGDDLY